MASASVRWDGLDELLAAMRALPAELTAEATEYAQQAVDRAEADAAAGYGHKSGNLRDHLRQTVESTDRFGVRLALKNTARHAWLWDYGTEARHYFTDAGKRHETGAMWGKRPPPFTFTRAVIRWRRWMYEQDKAMLERQGLIVSGEP